MKSNKLYLDASTQAEGNVQGLVIHKLIEKRFEIENLTVHLEKPEKKTFKVANFVVDAKAEEIYPENTPRGTQRSKSD